MQKKLMVLAVAAAVSGAALAQSNVQIYGSVDVGLSHRGDNIADNTGGKNSIDSGISSGNRLGFKGTEDLGNGVTALFVLESGFAADNGNLAQGGRLFGRQAYLGLTGNFGTFIAGRLYAPHYSLLSSVDPFRSGTVGQYRNVFASGLNTGGENLFDPTRVDNTVAYVTPSWGGFNVTAAYSTNAIGQEAAGNDHDNTVIALLPRYTNGPLDVGFSYHRIKDDDKGAGVLGTIKPKITNWAVAGTYDFKVVKLHAFYDKNKLTTQNPGWDDITLKSWLLGATVPFGKNAIQFSYTQSKLDDQTSNSAGKSKQWALGYTYALSKRTNFYAAYSDINNDNEKGNKANKVRRTASAGDSSNGGDGYQNGFNIGLKHTF
ncbi:MAG: porin [Zoogloeaceae bacterium]|nr:porin [Zoogloeaceae bacterium]